MIKYLLGKSSTGKFRWWTCETNEEYYDEAGYIIERKYGQVGGKITYGPDIYVPFGKAKRSAHEQLILQFNSEVKKQLDKGYKEVPKHPNEYTESELQEIYGDVKTRGEGIIKPMLAKQADKVAAKTFDKDYYGSRKVNGVRALIYCKDGKIHTASRGATNYDIAIIHIIQHPIIEEFFKNHPDVILDGEVYYHSWTLNKISGICRSQSTVSDGKDLQFYWYDIVELDKPFTERYKLMQEYAKELQLSEFDPYKPFTDEELHIQFLPQVEISGYDNMKKLHDDYVSEGWEGLVIRLASSVYKPGSRGNDWIKIKAYIDGEYPIVGLSEGLREEDMCFILETPSGQRFNCKPMGTREQKKWYREHIDELIGKMLTIKYFEMSGVEGSDIPQQPTGIAIRDYE
jgi:ATP-dependent DNA ligase